MMITLCVYQYYLINIFINAYSINIKISNLGFINIFNMKSIFSLFKILNISNKDQIIKSNIAIILINSNYKFFNMNFIIFFYIMSYNLIFIYIRIINVILLKRV